MTDIAIGHVESAPVHRDVAIAVRPEPAPDPDPWRKPAVTHPLPKRPDPLRETHSVHPVRNDLKEKPYGFMGASAQRGRKR